MRLAATVLLLSATYGSILRAQETPPPTSPHPYFPDTQLVNQDGKKVRLYSDLIKGKVVVINAFFTTCEGVCPVLTANVAKIQDWLGDRLGKDVVMISISVDPETDTVDKLDAYARRFKVKPGWHLLSGDPANVDFANSKLGQYTEIKEGHSNIVVVGNDRTGLWKKAFGLADGKDLIAVVESVLNDKG
ncbi:MAG: SCO family protein [Acidobacteriota bacterium]|nr:SCO family protein [Acidobacteriota bacterium]